MKKFFKWTGIVFGGLIVLVVLVGAGLYFSAGARLDKTYDIKVEALTIPQDAAAIQSGKHWVSILCTECHGENLAGGVIFQDPALGQINASNLTPGQGGVGKVYTDADWVRAIRHGVGPDGKPLLVMPSADFYNINDQVLGEIIADLKSLPPVDKEVQSPEFKPLGQVLLAAGAFGNIITAERIDQTAARPNPVAPAVSAEYGDYLSKIVGCRTCHGENFAGGKDPNPQAPPAPNITQSGSLKTWAGAEFILAARTRTSEFMVWKDLSRMTDDELQALWLYLKTRN